MKLLMVITIIVLSITINGHAIETPPTIPTATPDSRAIFPSCAGDGWIYSVALSPDGKMLLASWTVGVARLWDFNTGKVLQSFSTDPETLVNSVAFSPDGNLALVAGNKEADLWDIHTGKRLQRLLRNPSIDFFGGNGLTAAFLPDGKHIMTSAIEGAALWETKSGKLVHNFPGAMDPSLEQTTQLSRNGDFILTGISDPLEWTLWNSETGKVLHKFPDAWLVGFTPDSKAILTNGKNGLRQWDIATFHQTNVYETIPNFSRAWKLSDDGRFLAVDEGEGDYSLALWNLETNVKVHVFHNTGQQGQIFYQFLPNSKQILIADGYLSASPEYYRFHLWDIETERDILDFSAEGLEPIASAFTKDRKYWIAGSTDNKFYVVDIETGSVTQKYC